MSGRDGLELNWGVVKDVRQPIAGSRVERHFFLKNLFLDDLVNDP